MNKNVFKNIIVTVGTMCYLVVPSLYSASQEKLFKPQNGAEQQLVSELTNNIENITKNLFEIFELCADTDSKKQFASKLTNNIEIVAKDLLDTFLSFTSKTDNKPFWLYVEKLDTTINTLEQEILDPIKQQIKEAQRLGAKNYNNELVIIYDILTDFLEKIKAIVPILHEFVNRDSSSSSELIKKIKTHYATTINSNVFQITLDLKTKIDELHNLIPATSRSSVSKHINNMKTTLKNIEVNPTLKKRIDALVIFTCLSTKLRYNKIRMKK